ncbi:MAG: hypothetical protein WCJ61_08475 [Paludibacter sp.]
MKKDISGNNSIINSDNANSILTTLKFNGKSKSVDDFNVLETYYSRFKEQPHTIQIVHDESEFFKLDFIKKEITKEFPKSKILFRDSYYDVKKNVNQSAREVWLIEQGYIMNIYSSSSSVFYTNPELDVQLDKDTELISSNCLVCPPPDSKRYNPIVEKKIFEIFNRSVVSEITKNSVGLISMDANGSLYVREFTLDKKIRIPDLDLYYGEDFKDFSKKLIRRLTVDDKGLVLLHGKPGTGKCVHEKTEITVRDKKTGEIKIIKIEDLM